MDNKSQYIKMVEFVEKNNKTKEFHEIMNDYFVELEKFHPQTYNNLMKEINKLGKQINIVDKNELNKYLKNMKHENMPELWTVEQTNKVAKDININFDEWKYNSYTFNFVMNMMRTDYYNEFKKMFATSPLMKQTITDSASFYAHMAKAWLEDEDAPEDKVIKYIHLVLNEEE